MRDRQLTLSQKVVWVVIRDREGTNEKAWPSLSTIAKDSCLARSTVFEAIHGNKKNKGLVELGWLKVRKGSSVSTNVYECWVLEDEKGGGTEIGLGVVRKSDYPSTEIGLGGSTESDTPTMNEHNVNEYTEQTQLAPAARNGKKDNEIVEVMDEFRKVGITKIVNFANKTERYFAASLIAEYGKPKVMRCIKVAAEAAEAARSGEKYVPIITSPSSLVAKMIKLEQWYANRTPAETNTVEMVREIHRRQYAA
jgi:hypothetical protein